MKSLNSHGNSTDAVLKWRSGEPSLLPPSSFLAFPPYFMLLFPHFSDFPVSLFLPPLTLSPQFYLCVSAAVCFFYLPAHSNPFSLLVAFSFLSLSY